MEEHPAPIGALHQGKPMTSFLTTTCPNCGEIDVPLGEVVLRVNDDDGSGACVLRCADCGARFSKVADDSMMILLVAAGIEVQTWVAPAEIHERPSHLAPITHSELVAFAAMLDDPASLSGWMSAER